MRNLPPFYIVGGVVAALLIVAGAAVALPTDDAGVARFGLLLGLAGTLVGGLLALGRANDAVRVSDATKVDTGNLINGHLDTKIRDAVHAELLEHDVKVHGLTAPGAPAPARGRGLHTAKPVDTTP